MRLTKMFYRVITAKSKFKGKAKVFVLQKLKFVNYKANYIVKENKENI